MYIHVQISAMLSSSDMVCRGLNAVTIWSRPFERYIWIYIVIWHPNSYGYSYHHRKRIRHDILYPNFLRHQSQCFQNCLWLTLWIYDNLAIQTHFFGHISKYACGIHLTERFHAWWNVLQNDMHPREWHAYIIGHELYIHRQYHFFSWLRVRYIHRLARFRCIFNGEMPVSISIAIYKLHAS